MKPLEIETRVAAPASRVWSLMTDLDRAEEVVSAITRVERLDAGSGFGVGTRWRETRTIGGREATEEMEVTAVEPGRWYRVEAESRGARYRSTMGVEPVDDGTSRLYMTFSAEPTSFAGRTLGALLALAFRGATRRMLQRDLEDLARAAEGQSG